MRISDWSSDVCSSDLEPFRLLKPTYFNHAHNDFLEVVLDGGLPAALLLLVAIGWYAIASIRAWRARGRHSVLPKLGSSILLLVFVATAFDRSEGRRVGQACVRKR